MSVTINKLTSREYRDFGFPLTAHPDTHNLFIKTNINSVKQSVINLMTLAKGNKPFHPEIKSPLYEYLFENMGILERAVLKTEIKNYLARYEPRLKIENLILSYPDPNSINCVIEGSLLNSSEPITINVLVDRLR